MTFDPKAYAAVVRKMDGETLLQDIIDCTVWLQGEEGAAEAQRLRNERMISRAELLRRLSPKVDRAKLAELFHGRPYNPPASDFFADLIESGQVPTVEE